MQAAAQQIDDNKSHYSPEALLFLARTDFNFVEYSSREQWLAARQHGLGASQSAIVLDSSPWGSKFQLWGELTGLVERTSGETEAQKWGLRLERAVADGYIEECGGSLIDLGRHTILRSAKHPWLTCTLDYVHHHDSHALRVLEVKTAHASREQEWADEPPLHYLVQVQHQLAVTGLRQAVIACLLGGQRLVWHVVDRNDAFIEVLVRETKAFWDLVVARKPPTEVDGTKETAKALAAIRGSSRPVEDVRELGASWVEVDEELERLSDQIEELDTRRQELRNKLAHELTRDGGVGKLVLPTGVSYRYVEVTRGQYVVPASTTFQLRRQRAKGGK